MTIPKFLRFADLKSIGIANSWAQLKKLQDRHGFPAGRLLSPQVRRGVKQRLISGWTAGRLKRRRYAVALRS